MLGLGFCAFIALPAALTGTCVTLRPGAGNSQRAIWI